MIDICLKFYYSTIGDSLEMALMRQTPIPTAMHSVLLCNPFVFIFARLLISWKISIRFRVNTWPTEWGLPAAVALVRSMKFDKLQVIANFHLWYNHSCVCCSINPFDSPSKRFTLRSLFRVCVSVWVCVCLCVFQTKSVQLSQNRPRHVMPTAS